MGVYKKHLGNEALAASTNAHLAGAQLTQSELEATMQPECREKVDALESRIRSDFPKAMLQMGGEIVAEYFAEMEEQAEVPDTWSEVARDLAMYVHFAYAPEHQR